MEIIDVVKRLVGDIKPIGETYADERSLGNLKVMTTLVDELLENIAEVADYEDRVEYSMKVSGKHASGFLRHAIEEYNPDNKHHI